MTYLTRVFLCVAVVLATVLCAPWAWAYVSERASVGSADAQANAESGTPSLSSDGRYVTFVSAATNLTSGDSNGVYDIFVYDRQTGQTRRVSVSSTGVQADGDSRSPVISADGRYVAFLSRATNLVSGDTNGTWDVFVHTLATGLTERASVATSGAQSDADCTRVSIDGDGSIVCFTTTATNLIPNDTNGVADVFVRDLVAGTTERVSVGDNGVEADRRSDAIAVSADGRHVAFDSIADNLVHDDTNGNWDVFVRDLGAGSTSRVSVHRSGDEVDGDSICPSISADGRYVAFESEACGLVVGDTNGKWDVFVRDLVAGTTERASVGNGASEGSDDSDSASLSAGGRYVAFASRATDLVAGDTNGMWDVFVRDRVSGTTQRVSVSASGVQGYDDSDYPSLSGNGVTVAFESWADCLVASDTNCLADVFVVDVGGAEEEPGDMDEPGDTEVRPTISGLSPSSGPVSGGTSVVVTGTGFSDVSSVTFGGIDAVGFKVDSSTQVTAISPAHAKGAVQVQVVAGDLSSEDTASDDFEYLPPVLYQQTDSRLSYLGNWYTASTSWASCGSYAYTSSAGAMVTASFTGTSIKLTAKKGPQYGQALVRLDGGQAEYIDFYSPVAVCQQFVYQKEGLKDTTHTLTVEWAGVKNKASSGYYISLDVLVIEGALVQAITPTLYQQTDSHLNYTAAWYTSSTGSPSAGTFAYANSTGAAVNIKFEGTYLTWIAKTGPQYGKAKVCLDGGDPFYVDLYSPGSLYQQKVYDTGRLEDGTHTLTIQWTGLRNTRSIGYYINVDALEVMGTLVTAPVATWYQQSAEQLAYGGTWIDVPTSFADDGSFYYTNAVGASLLVEFEGECLEWYAKTSFVYGRALVSLDGGQAETVDLFSAPTLYRQCVYSTGALSAGRHTLSISWSGLKNPASVGTAINVDSLCVLGSLRAVIFDGLSASRQPFALVGQDKTRVTYTLSGAPTSVKVVSSTEGDLAVAFAGASGPTLPLTVDSAEVHSVAATVVSTTTTVRLDLARYGRYRIMSLPASQSRSARVLVDIYPRDDGPEGDGPPLVCLDPGHGASDPGTAGVVSKVPEKTATLAVGLLAKEYLADRGIGVLLTRDADEYLSLYQRCTLANNASASAFVSIHCNAFYDPTTGGTETFYQEKTPAYTAAATSLATVLQERVHTALGLKDRGARTYYVGTLGVLNGTVMPAALVELGFMSNPTEDAILTSSAGQQKAARAIAEAVCDYLGWSTAVYTSE